MASAHAFLVSGTCSGRSDDANRRLVGTVCDCDTVTDSLQRLVYSSRSDADTYATRDLEGHARLRPGQHQH